MSKKNFNRCINLFFIFYLIIGLIIYTDFGVGIEEHFQRQNGFYWLNYFFADTSFENFKSIVETKYQQILQADTDLPDPSFFNFYGIVFDLPLALIETFFQLDSSKSYFELRHLTIFLVFSLSAFYFYKIIKNRFRNNLVIFLGLFFYMFSPRIFGDSFHNNKDILFLSILTIAISYLFKLFEEQNNKNLILFCFFSALASSSRIMGIYLPLILIIFYFLDYLAQNQSFKKLIFKSLKIIIIFYIFLLLHYPYVWELNIFEINSWFKNFFYWMNIEVLFNGDYYMIKYLPRSYLPVWIFISTPIILSILLIVGVFLVVKIIFFRLINIDQNKKNKKGDFWKSIDEKKDFFVFVSFFSFFSYAIFLNVAMLSGWRHFYFLHFFIIYFSTLGLDNIFSFLQKKFKFKITHIISFIIVLHFSYINIKFHPFQSLYFNSFLSSNKVSGFQVDSPNLSRSDALKFIIKTEKNKTKKIYVGNASWSPMSNGKDMLSDVDQKRLVFVGQELTKADYIYTNYVYKSDEKYNKKYKVPLDFDKIKDYKINNVLIYTVFKKKN